MNTNFEIPTEKLNNTINNSINRGQKFKRMVRLRRIALASLLVGGISIFNISHPVYAENIPVIGTVFQKINSSLGINKNTEDYIKYSQSINKSVENNGFNIKVTEAILDDHRNLILCYEVKNQHGFSKDTESLKNSLGALNLNALIRASFQPHYNEDPNKVSNILPLLSKNGDMLTFNPSKGIIDGKFIDNNTFIGKAEYNLSSFKNVPNSFKIKLNIKELDFLSGKTIVSPQEKSIAYTALTNSKGNWNLEFVVKKSKIKTLKEITPNVSSENVTINKVTVTPFTTDISAKVNFSKVSKLKVIDETNKEYFNYNTINKKDLDSKFTDITFRFNDISTTAKKLNLIFLDNNNKEVFSYSVSLS